MTCFFSSLLLHSTGHKIQWIPPNTTLICRFSPYSSPTSCSWTCPLLPGFPQQLQAGLPAFLAPIPIPQRRLWETFLLKSLCLKPRYSFSATVPLTRFMRSSLSLHLTASLQTICSHSKEVLPPFLEYTRHCLFADAFLTCLDSSPTSFSSSGAVYYFLQVAGTASPSPTTTQSPFKLVLSSGQVGCPMGGLDWRLLTLSPCPGTSSNLTPAFSPLPLLP